MFHSLAHGVDKLALNLCMFMPSWPIQFAAIGHQVTKITKEILRIKSDAKRFMEMTKEESEIIDIVNKETNAWNNRDVDALIGIFHPDMVWPWPESNTSHDLFDRHTLIHNLREIKKIVVSKEKDGAFAVVDIDTLWMDHHHQPNHWKGRTCKIYTKMGREWKMIMQTGVLEY